MASDHRGRDVHAGKRTNQEYDEIGRRLDPNGWITTDPEDKLWMLPTQHKKGENHYWKLGWLDSHKYEFIPDVTEAPWRGHPKEWGDTFVDLRVHGPKHPKALPPSTAKRPYNWEVRVPMVPSDTNLGKRKSYESEQEPENEGPDRTWTRIEGNTRTLRRAQIAADAMYNRIVEGRNLRTGRPIFSSEDLEKWVNE